MSKESQQLSHADLVRSLYDHLWKTDNVVIAEVAVGSRWLQRDVPIPDVLMFRKSYVRPDLTAFEVKASRGDFLGEMRSGKYQKYFKICNRVYFATPSEGVMTRAEVPEGCGWWTYHPEKRSWSCRSAAKRWEGDLGKMEWMSLLFSLKENQIRIRSLKERLNLEENAKLDEIAKGLPYKFKETIRKHGSAVRELESRRQDIASILDCPADWSSIIGSLRGLSQRVGGGEQSGNDIGLGLDIARHVLNKNDWGRESLIVRIENFLDRLKKENEKKYEVPK